MLFLGRILINPVTFLAQAAALEYGRQRLGQLRSDVGYYLLEGTARGHSVEVLAWWD